MKSDWIIVFCSAAFVIAVFSVAFLEGASLAQNTPETGSQTASIR